MTNNILLDKNVVLDIISGRPRRAKVLRVMFAEITRGVIAAPCRRMVSLVSFAVLR